MERRMPLALFVAVCVAVLSTGCTRPHGPTGPAATTGAPAGDTAGGNGSPVALWRVAHPACPPGGDQAPGPPPPAHRRRTAPARRRGRRPPPPRPPGGPAGPPTA